MQTVKKAKHCEGTLVCICVCVLKEHNKNDGVWTCASYHKELHKSYPLFMPTADFYSD